MDKPPSELGRTPYTYAADSLPELTAGTVVGNYRLVRRLELASGLSSSYLAEHVLFERKVVFMHVHFSERASEHFASWIAAMERLRHPCVVTFLDCGEYGGFHYAVTQYVEGRTLDQIVQSAGALDVTTALQLLSVVADVLAHCHSQGFVHGNLKAAHVIVASSGGAFVKGFESARPLQQAFGVGWSPPVAAPEVWLNQQAIGLGHVSIEHSTDESLAPSDIWSFGMLLFLALTGRYPLNVPTPFDPETFCLTSDFVVDLSSLQGKAPLPVAQLIGRCLQLEPSRRYQDGTELMCGLRALLDHIESERDPPRAVEPRVGHTLLLFAEPLVPGLPGSYLEVRVLAVLGSGAFAQVYCVESPEGQPAALKVLRADLAEDPECLERFHREGVFLSRVDHPNVVRAHATGRFGVSCFILEELLTGPTLQQWMGANPVRNLKQAAAIIRGITGDVAALHEAGLVHRDLKPANVLLVDEGHRVVIADLGVTHSKRSRITRTGAFLGTPAYAAPEQLLGVASNEQADLYALGVLFFELLTGQLPHGATSVRAVLRRYPRRETDDVRFHLPSCLPPLVVDTVAGLLHADPAQRIASADELQSTLTDPCFDFDVLLHTSSRA